MFFVNDMTDKGSLSKICKQLIQPNLKNTNNPIKKGQTPEETFFQRRHTAGQAGTGKDVLHH